MDEIISNRIKALRKELNMTQGDLCRVLNDKYNMNTPQSTISKWENNKQQPEINNLRVLSQIFGVTMNYLSGLSDRRDGGLIAHENDPYYPEDDMPLLDENGNPMIYSEEMSIRQTLRENRELRMLLSASSKLNKDDLEQLIRLAKLMDKE